MVRHDQDTREEVEGFKDNENMYYDRWDSCIAPFRDLDDGEKCCNVG